MDSIWERMLAEGVKCLYCGNKMERTTRQEFESASGLHEYICPFCRFVAYFVGNANKESDYYGVRMR